MLEGAAAVGRVIIGIGLAARLTADHPFLGFRTVIGVIDMLRALDGVFRLCSVGAVYSSHRAGCCTLALWVAFLIVVQIATSLCS